MNTNMERFITPGIIHFMAFPETIKGEGAIVESVKKIALDEYFGFIELTWIKDNAVRQEVKSILDTAGLDIGYGAQPRTLITGMNINDLNESKRKAAVAILKEGIDEAYELGAKGFGFLSGSWEVETKENSYSALKESTSELCSYAKERGSLKIHLEIFDYDIDKCSLIGPVSLAKRFAQDMAEVSDNFGLLPDLSHMPLLRESPEEALLPIKDFISHVHMGNCVVKDPNLPAYGDQHPRFGFPDSENGVPELTEFIRTLIKIGYLEDGKPKPVSFEVKPYKGEDPELVIANAKRYLNKAWSLL